MSPNQRLKKAMFLALLLAMLPALVLAQAQTSGTISGTVVDDDGAPVTGATVSVESTRLGFSREQETDRNGTFQFRLLPVGHWTVTITAPGKQPQVYSFDLGVGENVPVAATLLEGDAVSEEVTVLSTATAMSDATSSTNLDYRRTIEELPFENRNINNVARLSPQISDHVQTGGTIGIAGAPTFDTTVLLDGAEVSDPFFGSGTTVWLEDAIEEVQVIVSGVDARYGRFQGGIINAITKSGSNQFEATVRYEFDKETWNSQTPFDEPQSDNLNEIYQGTLGGYMLKDRAWFFGGYREIPATTVSATTAFSGEAFSQGFNEERWQLKLRGAPVPNHIVDVGHLEFEATTDPWFAANLRPATLDVVNGVRGDPRETNTLTYQGVLNPSLFLELQATEKEVGIFAGGAPNGRHPFIDWSTFFVYNNYWWSLADVEGRNNETASGNATYSLATDSVGTHSIEGGVQYVNSMTSGLNQQSPTGINVIGFNTDFVAGAGSTPLFNLRNGQVQRWKSIPLAGGQDVENVGVYLQDTATIGDFRIDVGLRYDDYQGSGPLPQFGMAFDDIAPRLALTYNINDRWQAVATWGEYVSRLNDNVVQNATGIGSNPGIDHDYTGPDLFGLTAAQVNAIAEDDSQWLDVAGFNGPGSITTYLANNIKAPVAEDRSLSLRYALPRNTGTMVVNWVDRTFKGLIDDFQGGVCDFGIPFDAPCPEGNLSPILNPDGSVATFVDTIVWANNPDAVREYEGLSFQGEYRPSSKVTIGGSHTFSKQVGNYEGEGANTPSSGTFMGNHVRSIPPELVGTFGYLDEDVRHRSRIWASYRFAFGRAGNLSLSTLYNYNSGQRWTKLATVPLANDPLYVSDSGTFTGIFGGRGAQRFDDIQRFDLAARYDVAIFRKVGVWVKASVVNVFNADDLLRHQTTGAAPVVNGFRQWQPNGTCGLDDEPSTTCSSFGRIRNELDYQRPREFFFTVGFKY